MTVIIGNHQQQTPLMSNIFRPGLNGNASLSLSWLKLSLPHEDIHTCDMYTYLYVCTVYVGRKRETEAHTRITLLLLLIKLKVTFVF